MRKGDITGMRKLYQRAEEALAVVPNAENDRTLFSLIQRKIDAELLEEFIGHCEEFDKYKYNFGGLTKWLEMKCKRPWIDQRF